MAGALFAAAHYRLIAEISMGAGTLAMIGGTVVIVGFLTPATGSTLAVQGYYRLVRSVVGTSRCNTGHRHWHPIVPLAGESRC